MSTIMRIKMESAACAVLAAGWISLFVLESVVGDEQVRFPDIINWWDRDWVTKKPQTQPFISAAYYFPYMCSIIYYNKEHMESGLLVGEWVSVCTILTKRWVVYSVDNMDRPCDNHNSRFHTIQYHHSVFHKDLKVVHGTVYGSPSTDFQNSLIKKHTIDRLLYVNSYPFPESPRVTVLNDFQDQENFNLTEDFVRNAIGGVEAAVAYARIADTGFVWDSFTLPAPIIAATVEDVTKKVEGHIKFLEEQTSSQKSCYVGAYHRFNKKMKWFQVMYIPHDECREVYCTYDSRACLEFPKTEHHVCFKSLIYGDLCPEDRGTAVYCPDFEHSVFAILTTAPNCGWKNLPNVYTRIDIVLRVFAVTRESSNLYIPGFELGLIAANESWRTYKYPEDLKQYTLMPPGMVRGP